MTPFEQLKQALSRRPTAPVDAPVVVGPVAVTPTVVAPLKPLVSPSEQALRDLMEMPPQRTALDRARDRIRRPAPQTPPASLPKGPGAESDCQGPEAENGLTFFKAPGTYTPICVLHGPGGTGKTFRIRQYQEQHPETNILMTATTGVAAINIGPGCTTINSAFRYFDEESLKEKIEKNQGQISRELDACSMLVIDEMSMLSSTALEMIYSIVERCNATRKRPIQMVLSGDFCQLPPVTRSLPGKAQNEAIPFAFKSDSWMRCFEPAIQKLTKNFRQSGDLQFQEALNRARHGNGAGCVAVLNCNYASVVNMDFEGLTLYGVNKDVNLHNNAKLTAITEPLIIDPPDLWGEPDARAWKDQIAPNYVKLTAQVRVTANQTPGFEYVNGDIGTLLAYEPGRMARIQLHRNGKPIVTVKKITRVNMRALKPGERPPTECNGTKVPTEWKDREDKLNYEGYIIAGIESRQPFYDPRAGKWVIGAITYVPVALGWSSTIHRAQGLTLASVQIDIAHRFSGSPQMMYVALSRCREASNIVITRGNAKTLVDRINYHPEIQRYM